VSDLSPPAEGDRPGPVHRGAGRSDERRAPRTHRLALVVPLAALALVAAACSSSSAPGAGTTTASTFAGGSPWLGTFTTATLPEPVNALTDVACATALRCWAVGSTVGGSGAPNGAAVIATTDGGATWTNQPIPGSVGYLSRIACSDRRTCVAVGQAAQTSNGQAISIATTDGGASWTVVPSPDTVLDITALTCRADRSCLAVGTTANGSAALTEPSPGSAWVQRGPLPTGITGATAISCTTARICLVTGSVAVAADHSTGTVALTTDGGTTWAAEATPKGLGELNGISCLSGPVTGAGAIPAPSTAPTTAPPTTVPTTASTATASTVTTTTAAGSSPSTTTAPTTTVPTTTVPTTTVPTTTTTAPAPLVGVSGARCVVTGTTATVLSGARAGKGVLLTTANGGATWTSQPVPAAAAAFSDVSCIALDTCVAVGSTVGTARHAGVIVVTGSPGRPWASSSSVAAPQSLSAVSCVSLSACVVVGESISQHLS
jgi:hypothetical protein